MRTDYFGDARVKLNEGVKDFSARGPLAEQGFDAPIPTFPGEVGFTKR